MFEISPSKFTITTIIYVSLLSSSSFAQDAEKMPLLKDIDTHENLPNDRPYDIRGFSLLSDIETVEALKSKYPESEFRWSVRSENRGLRDNRGNSVSYEYGPKRYTISRVKNGFEEYQLRFTSGLLGNRVYNTDLNITFKPEVELQSFINAIKTKYGEPSFAGAQHGRYEIGYTFQDGVQLVIDFPSYQTERYRDPTVKAIGDCLTSRQQITNTYQFKQKRERKAAGCNGAIYLQLTFGSRPDLIRQAVIQVWDYDLGYKNLVAQDEFLLKSLNDAVDNKTGTEAPKL